MKNQLPVFLLIATCITSRPILSYTQETPQKSFHETYIYGCDPENSGYEENPVCGVVIALSGLKLRATPDFNGKTLAVIPFGETVARTENAYEFKNDSYTHPVYTTDSVAGYWQEIMWKGKKGFAFSAYIGDAVYRMEDDGYLLFETGWNCWNDCYASPAYFYYGVFTNRDSSRWEIHQIKPSFIFSDIDFPGITIKSNAKKPVAFILASKRRLGEGLLMAEGKKRTIFHRQIHQQGKETINKVPIPVSQFSLTVVPLPENRVNLVLSEKSSGRKQVIGANFYADHITMIWSGDLDQDGIMDFMLSYSTDDSYGCQLFLSGAAGRNQLVKPLKIYWYGDCC